MRLSFRNYLHDRRIDVNRTYERPTGLSIVAVLWGISGGLAVLSGLGVMAAGAAFASWVGAFDAGAGGGAFAFAFIVGLIFIAIGAGGFLVAMGLWRMRDWAWWVAVILTGIVVFFDVVTLLTVPLVALSGFALLLIAVHVGTLVYLLMDEAKTACGIGAGSARRPALPPRRRREDVCPNLRCGRQVQSHWRFCPACRTNLDSASTRPVVSAR
jgi:hypothetical protein